MGTETKINTKRVRRLNNCEIGTGVVVYWMSRDQRVLDNWALIYATEIARQTNKKLEVVFCLTTNFPKATNRHYKFMIEGLKHTEKSLSSLGIKFNLIVGDIEKKLLSFLKTKRPGLLVTDFSPLRNGRSWRDKIANEIDIAMHEVDAHNIVPVWIASNKKEWAAYTLRPKINSLLGDFLTVFPAINPLHESIPPSVNWGEVQSYFGPPIDNLQFIPGENEARRRLDDFLQNKLIDYEKKRNDPSIDGQSNLSPYLHFGHISSQRIAIEAKKLVKDNNSKSFLEEVIIRKELADNFCFYDKNYDNPLSFPKWATETLKKHSKDKREHIYTSEEFEFSKTHDEIWNAAQCQMVKEGKMHGYMRMYWAKKILEWTRSASDAMEIAIYLNDKYQLDGRDPNGYAGIAWSIGGVHDRPWFERNIFGQIRYMSSSGLEKKFNLKNYVSKYKSWM